MRFFFLYLNLILKKKGGTALQYFTLIKYPSYRVEQIKEENTSKKLVFFCIKRRKIIMNKHLITKTADIVAYAMAIAYLIMTYFDGHLFITLLIYGVISIIVYRMLKHFTNH